MSPRPPSATTSFPTTGWQKSTKGTAAAHNAEHYGGRYRIDDDFPQPLQPRKRLPLLVAVLLLLFYPSPLERPETAKKYKDLLKIHQYADSRRVEWEEGGIATYQWMAVDQCVVAKFCGAAENFDRLNTVVGTYLPRWID